MLNPSTVWITTNFGKFLKKWEYQTTFPVSWETCMKVKKLQLVPYMEQWTGSKLGEEYIKAVYCHSAYLTYMWNAREFEFKFAYLTYMWNIMGNARLDEAETGIKIPGRNISNLRYADDTTFMTESEEELKSVLMKVK